MANDIVTIIKLLAMAAGVVSKLTELARRASRGEVITNDEVKAATKGFQDGVQGWDEAAEGGQ